MKDLKCRASFIARSGLPVFIEGESGSGKETLAEHLHLLSEAPNFMRIRCHPSGLTFVSGSYANGQEELSDLYRRFRGTMFLKNVHLLSLAMQECLLALIEQGGTRTHGANTEFPRVRLMASATESLESFVMRQQFLPALYYQLSVYKVLLPPLRERTEDTLELFGTMLLEAGGPGGGTAPVPTAGMLQAIAEYSWPGNLRELYNVAQMYRLTGDAEEIVAEIGQRSATSPGTPGDYGVWPSLKEQVRGASRRLESEIILRTLERHRWNRRRTAQTLKISYRSLLYKMKGCNLRLEAEPSLGETE